MALTDADVVAALRLGDSTEELAQARRLRIYADREVTRMAPNAPAACREEACIRLIAYYFDMPNSPKGDGYANAMRNSGAGAILLPYREHRAGDTA